MNTFALAVFCVAVASASAGHLGYGGVYGLNPAAHIASGSVGVSADGAVIAGPSGSVRTNNGLHGHGAGAQLSGPAGDVATHGGHARLAGPGHDAHALAYGAHVAPVAYAAPLAHHSVVAAPLAHHTVVAAPIAHHAVVAGPAAHTTIIGARSHATVVAPAHHGVYGAGIYGAPAVSAWGHHGLVGHGVHAW